MSDRAKIQDQLCGYLKLMKMSGLQFLPRADIHAKAPVEALDAEPEIGRKPQSTPQLFNIRNELVDCNRCGLGSTRTNIVFGAGNPEAELLLVGEAPGKDEDIKGSPFVGEAGELLTRIIEAIGLKRSDVYICNVIKCRPPENRDPLPEEIEACGPFLLKQIEAINPKVICALGGLAARTLLETKTPISELRGSFHDYHGIPLMPTYHPAFLLRNPKMKRDVWKDVQAIQGVLLGKEKPSLL